MKIYFAEINDGLEHKLQTVSSITYASFAEPCLNKRPAFTACRAMAALNDEDLYYVQSILVTSSWNKNDDIFDKLEIWNARNTPEDKPTNLEHDESIIIGHITSNWPITEDGKVIGEDANYETLPDKYHILTGSVIYRGFSSPELRTRAEKLITEIENGQKYVSMECFFNGFDYGLINKTNGTYKTLERNENTAYLTKYLKAYGGIGEHEGYKIGRVLRNIVFSGKGFVNKPANPESIIFNKNLISENACENLSEKKQNLSKSGVSINQLTSNAENNTMSLENQTAVSEEVKVETTESSTDTSVSAMTSMPGMPELEAAMNDKQKELDTLKSAYDALKTEKEEALDMMKKEMAEKEGMWNKQNTDMSEMLEKMKSSLDEANNSIAAYKNKEEEMKKKEKKAKRLATLIEVGVANSLAAATVDKLELVDDETFAAMTSLFSNKTESQESNSDAETVQKEEASVNSADPAVLETVEIETDVNLSIGGETESKIETTRAALVEYVSSILGKKS
jgi:hypothetical protein